MGYGDGYPRNIPENTPVLINGRRVPIVGRVSMDMIVVDLGANCQDRAGDEVIFWGKGLPVEEIAKHTGISSYELLTRLTSRAQIHYINDDIN
ncbi:alanine racemase C-terminal domain-containing protein [Orbaceae bacterium ESL0721]|nr:alanine racemase C-terminal domain-containing protein [Orbaceae bacterium ESL0721]MDF7671608.1 alanine racemase C-terminal domain-containing protein [Orbaceae bacterium ESL0721]